MRRALRFTTSLYISMGLTIALSVAFSSRVDSGADEVCDRIFPLIERSHPRGGGSFVPGTFLASFLIPSLAGMLVLNLAAPSLFTPVVFRRANVFYYILLLVLAILEIGSDTLVPLVALPGPRSFGAAVGIIDLGFLLAFVVAALAARGAQRVW